MISTSILTSMHHTTSLSVFNFDKGDGSVIPMFAAMGCTINATICLADWHKNFQIQLLIMIIY